MKKLTNSILAEGEVTGHAHRLPEAIDVFERKDQVRVFDLESGVPLTHEEHGTIHLPAGEYLSDRVLEQDHFAEEARRVAD